MTNYELHYLISEYVGHISSTYEGWFAASSAVLLISHYLGQKLTNAMRGIVACTYLIYSLVCYLGLIKFYYTIEAYTDEIENLGDIPIPVMPYIDISNGFLVIYIFIGGTLVVSGYFWRSTQQKLDSQI